MGAQHTMSYFQKSFSDLRREAEVATPTAYIRRNCLIESHILMPAELLHSPSLAVRELDSCWWLSAYAEVHQRKKRSLKASFLSNNMCLTEQPSRENRRTNLLDSFLTICINRILCSVMWKNLCCFVLHSTDLCFPAEGSNGNISISPDLKVSEDHRHCFLHSDLERAHARIKKLWGLFSALPFMHHFLNCNVYECCCFFLCMKMPQETKHIVTDILHNLSMVEWKCVL